MAGLPSKTQAQYVSDMTATWAALLGVQPTLAPGGVIYNLMQTVSAQFLFLQALAQVINQVARVQTSSGADVDSFMAQFGFTRLPAIAAVGPVTLSKFSPATSQVLVQPGAIVQTLGGAIAYQVIADPNQPTWNATLNAYVLAVGQSSLVATAQAVQPGTAYNVTAGQLAQIGSNLAGIDQVTNSAPITNGADAESDAAFESRFVLYLNSLSKATYGAIVSAITGVQQGIEYNLLENQDTSLASQPGEFVAVIDDGTGSPPAALIASVQNILEVTRGFTIEAQTIPVVVVTATIAIAVRINPNFDSGTVLAAVAEAIAEAVNGTPIGGGEFW